MEEETTPPEPRFGKARSVLFAPGSQGRRPVLSRRGRGGDAGTPGTRARRVLPREGLRRGAGRPRTAGVHDPV